jgi:DNA-binding GntR family transcriptional regulator
MDALSSVVYYDLRNQEIRELIDQASNRLSDKLLETIEERIVTGEYPAGTRLDEVELAEAFAVSRTPIREALIQLSVMNMIEKRPRKGWVVTEVSPARLCEMFEVMAELEAMCGRLAARRASLFQQQRIKAAHEACRNAKDPDTYFRLNEEFHHAIYEASQNAFLIEEVCALARRVRPYRRLQLRVRERLKTSFQEHEGIVNAILAGDSALAEERLRSHVIVQGQRFSDLVESMEKISEPAKRKRA